MTTLCPRLLGAGNNNYTTIMTLLGAFVVFLHLRRRNLDFLHTHTYMYITYIPCQLVLGDSTVLPRHRGIISDGASRV